MAAIVTVNNHGTFTGIFNTLHFVMVFCLFGIATFAQCLKVWTCIVVTKACSVKTLTSCTVWLDITHLPVACCSMFIYPSNGSCGEEPCGLYASCNTQIIVRAKLDSSAQAKHRKVLQSNHACECHHFWFRCEKQKPDRPLTTACNKGEKNVLFNNTINHKDYRVAVTDEGYK
jgi:ribonucleotide reductase alpha subunit